MTYHQGYLLVGEQNGNYAELFNHARTAAYLQSSTVLGCGSVYGVLDDGGCEGYSWVPPTMDGGAPPGADTEPDGWYRQEYTTPAADGAPWYNAAYPESGKALGFWITEWTGLDSGHISRDVTAVGAYRGGGELGRLGSSARTMGFEVILLGESEAALDHLFRWLDATISSVCHTCAKDSILIRRICPDLSVDDASDGVVEIREVGLIGGVVWGAPPVERAGCFIRQVNFTMAAMDPCMYAPCSDVPLTQTMLWDTCFATANLRSDRVSCRPTCSEMSGACRTVFDYTVDSVGASGLVLDLTPPVPTVSGSNSLPIRIRTYANPNGLDADELCGAPLLAELYVTSLPAYSRLRYDMPGRRVQYADSGTGDWINGYAFLAPNDVGVPRFPGLACGDYTTIVEPADFCLPSGSLTARGAFNNFISRTALFGDRLYAIGSFTTPVAAPRFTGITASGNALPSFVAAVPVSEPLALVVESSGEIIIGGSFATIDGPTTRNGLARILTSGALDTTYNIGASPGVTGGTINKMVLQADGMLIAAGTFTTARGVTKNGLARFNGDGTLDTSYNVGGTVGVAGGAINATALQPDGKLIVAGTFTSARGTTANRVARLNTDGTRDATFDTTGTRGANGPIYALVVQPDGKVVIAGDFTSVQGTPRSRLARLNADGSIDPSYNAADVSAVGSAVTTMVQSGTGVMIGGVFTTVGGVTRLRIARVDSAGVSDPLFVGTPNSTVSGLSRGVGGTTYVSGGFTTFNGVAQNRLTQIDQFGEIVPSWEQLLSFPGFSGFPAAEAMLQERMGCA